MYGCGCGRGVCVSVGLYGVHVWSLLSCGIGLVSV